MKTPVFTIYLVCIVLHTKYITKRNPDFFGL